MKRTKKLLSADLALGTLAQHIFLYPQSILSLMAVEKSFAPITCQIYSECRQSSLIKLSITGEEMVVRNLGRRGKSIAVWHSFSTSCTASMNDRVLFRTPGFTGSSGVLKLAGDGGCEKVMSANNDCLWRVPTWVIYIFWWHSSVNSKISRINMFSFYTQKIK